MEIQTVQRPTIQDTGDIFDFETEVQASLARDGVQTVTGEMVDLAAEATTVLPAQGAPETPFVSLVGGLLVRFYHKLSGPALSDRDRLRIAIQMEEDQWYRHW